MNLKDALDIVILPGLRLLPARMDTPEARAMLLAIGQQEGDRFRARRQYEGGPARGFFQFEMNGGVRGVLTHQATKDMIYATLDFLQYKDHSPQACHAAIEHNDQLATVFARLLLYTLPAELPKQGDYDGSWKQYIAAWQPGRPRRESWNKYYALAWASV